MLAASVPGVAAAQPIDEASDASDEPTQAHAPPPMSSASPWSSDPFAGMLLGFEAPAGVGVGLVYTGDGDSAAPASAPTGYSASPDESERTASLVAYPIGRGVLVTGMFRYVQLSSALDIAMGRASPWTSVAARGGGIGLVGAF